jgi:hypothetical protein
LIVAETLLLEPDDALVLGELEVLLLLDPHAAIATDASTPTPAPTKRLVFKVFSLLGNALPSLNDTMLAARGPGRVTGL